MMTVANEACDQLSSLIIILTIHFNIYRVVLELVIIKVRLPGGTAEG